MPDDASDRGLPRIPVVLTGPDFALETFHAERPFIHALMDEAVRNVPRFVLKALDAISRRWLERHGNPYLAEIDHIAAQIDRPGAYFLSVNYEWGCTVGVGAAPDGRSARLARTLDWDTRGLAKGLIAANVACPAGPFVTLTWPGYTGVLQAMAPGRFCAAINQAPMRKLGGGMLVTDWIANRLRVWNQPHQTATHLLRRVFETAGDYAQARAMLVTEPIAAPVTFTLAGMAPAESCMIERSEQDAFVVDGATAATNHWCGLDHGARPRGEDSAARRQEMLAAAPFDFDADFPWLKPPILNDITRLAMIADASVGRLMAQGYAGLVPATAVLDLTVPALAPAPHASDATG